MALTYLKPTSPRGIITIPNPNINLSVIRDPVTSLPKYFSFHGLDISDLYGAKQIRKDAEIILEISNEVDLNRFELGTITSPKYLPKEPINLDGSMTSLVFSLFVVEGFKVRASREKVKVKDDFHDQNREGLITFEPEENMGEITWRLDPVDGSKEPVIKVNNDPTVGIMDQLYSGNTLFRGLIVINAIEQYLYILARETNDDEWTNKWKLYLSERGIDEFPDPNDNAEINEWVQISIKKISEEFSLFSMMKFEGSKND